MTPQELGRALAEEMRKQAIVDRDIANGHTHNAVDFQKQAENSRHLAQHFRAMADGWEQTADKLASGAITLGDAETLAALRGGLADVQETIDPQRMYLGSVAVSATESLPVFGAAEALASTPLAVAFGAEQQPAQDAEATYRRAAGVDEDGVPYEPEASGFELDDVVNVCDPESRSFGLRGTVVNTWSNGGSITVLFDDGHTWSFRASQLMHHAAFVAQMDAANAAAEQPAPYIQAQLDGDNCARCGQPLDGGQSTGPDGKHDGRQLFSHLACIEADRIGGAS